MDKLDELEALLSRADKHGWGVDEDGDLVARVPTCWREGAWQEPQGRANATAIVAAVNWCRDEGIALARQSAEQAARVVELEAENARLRFAADMAANTFERYERMHREKGTHDGEQKAYSNGQLAYEMRAALGAS